LVLRPPPLPTHTYTHFACHAPQRLKEEAQAAALLQAQQAAASGGTHSGSQQDSLPPPGLAPGVPHDPAAAASLPVEHLPVYHVEGAMGVGRDSGATQPTHPMQGSGLPPGTAPGAGGAQGMEWVYTPQHPHQHQQHAVHAQPAAAAAAALAGAPQQQQQQQQQRVGKGPSQAELKQQRRQQQVAAKQARVAAAEVTAVADRMAAAAIAAALLSKRDKVGRFYRKEHLQAWARLLFERGQLAVEGLEPPTAEEAGAAATAQDAAMAAGKAPWPTPPWVLAAREAASAAAKGGSSGGTHAAAAAAPGGKSGSGASKAAAASGAGAKKASASSGASVAKKAQPAVLVSEAGAWPAFIMRPIRCITCGCHRPPPSSARHHPCAQRMNDLQLTGCLRRFVRPERLGPGAHWRCSACGSTSEALKQLSIRRLPLVLCFHVKRFEHGGGVGQRPRKLDVPLRFPLHKLDMAPFTTATILAGAAAGKPAAAAAAAAATAAAAANGAAAGAAAARQGGAAPAAAGAGASFQQQCLYELFGVVSHWGDMSSGHYVSYVKCEGHWYLINDPWVVPVSEADVAGVQAYMLFYAQEHLFGSGSRAPDGDKPQPQQQQPVKAEQGAAGARTAPAAATAAAAAAAAAAAPPAGSTEAGPSAAAAVKAASGVKVEPGAAAVKQEASAQAAQA
jgi:hypothetical protein